MTLTEADFQVIRSKMDKIDQRLNGLYQNWQAEYKEAVTSEEYEEIRKFYKPYFREISCIRYYNKLIRNQLDSYLPKEPTSEITPSLAVLDDAPAFETERVEKR